MSEFLFCWGNTCEQKLMFLVIIWKTMLKLRFRRQSWASYHGTPDFDGFDRFCDEASAHMLIEEAMITCNSCCSHFLHQKVNSLLHACLLFNLSAEGSLGLAIVLAHNMT